MAGEQITNSIDIANIKDTNNNGLRVDDLLNEFNSDSKLTKQEREEIRKMYESEKQLISNNTSQEIVTLRQKIEGVLEISKIKELSGLDGFDEFLSMLSKTDSIGDFNSIVNKLKLLVLLPTKAKEKVIDLIDSSLGGEGFPKNIGEAQKFTNTINQGNILNKEGTGVIQTKTVETQTKTVETQTKTVETQTKTEALSLLKNGKLKDIYKKYFGELKGDEPQCKEILEKNIDNILKDVVELVKNSSNPEEFLTNQKEAKDLIIKLSDSGMISKDKVVSFIKELEGLSYNKQRSAETKTIRTSQIESSGLNIDVTKSKNNKFETIPDSAGISQEIVIARNGDVRRSIVSGGDSEKGKYTREVPIFLANESITSKLNSAKCDLIINKEKQAKLDEFIKNNPEMSQEDKKKTEAMSNGLKSEEKELSTQIRILENSMKVSEDKIRLENRLIETNSKFIRFLDNTGMTSLGQNAVDSILETFEQNNSTINPGKKGDFSLENGFGESEQELLLKGLAKITKIEFNPNGTPKNISSGKSSGEELRNILSQPPRVLEDGVFRLENLKERLGTGNKEYVK